MPARLGAEHAVLKGLRDRRSETELTRVLAEVFRADPTLGGRFVDVVLRRSKRPNDPRWAALPTAFACRSEVQIQKGFVDLEFKDVATGWRVLVELKIDAGYGFEQIERYLACLDQGDDRQVLVSITRDVPKYGDPPVDDDHPGWAGSVAWAALFDDLRALRSENATLETQWRLLFDVLEQEGSMGITKVEPELLRTWANAVPARQHAVAFMDALRYPLLEALYDALTPSFPGLERGALAAARPTSDGRRPQVDVEFEIPRGGPLDVSAQLWAWDDLRFGVSVRYPTDDRSSRALEAITHLAAAGFENWKNRWLWRSLPIDDDLLQSGETVDRLLAWAKESFDCIARSGILTADGAPPDQRMGDELSRRPASNA